MDSYIIKLVKPEELSKPVAPPSHFLKAKTATHPRDFLPPPKNELVQEDELTYETLSNALDVQSYILQGFFWAHNLSYKSLPAAFSVLASLSQEQAEEVKQLENIESVVLNTEYSLIK